MLLLIAFVQFFPDTFFRQMGHFTSYAHIKFIHILTVTLFFGNAVIGTLWEFRALLSKRAEIIRYTYETVTWLDAVFTAPLILCAATSGIMLAHLYGGIWTIGWISYSLSAFLLSGIFWLAADIPTQYKIRKALQIESETSDLFSPSLLRLFWLRMGINLISLIPLLFVFYLMVHKPEM